MDFIYLFILRSPKWVSYFPDVERRKRFTKRLDLDESTKTDGSDTNVDV